MGAGESGMGPGTGEATPERTAIAGGGGKRTRASHPPRNLGLLPGAAREAAPA
jgi:hypothetical protein